MDIDKMDRTECIMFSFSDAWLLTTLILFNDWVTLQQVIAGGDIINHCIFTTEEINRALSSLSHFGYVEINEEKLMRATDKAHGLCDETYARAGFFRKIERIYSKLSRMPWTESVSLKVFFSDDEVKQACNRYLSKCMISSKRNIKSIGP